MLNFLWIFMILAGIVYAAFTGNLPAVTDAALDAAQQAVTLCITMAGAGVLGRSYADRRKCRDDAAGGRPDLPVASFFVSAYSAGTCSMQIHCSQLYRQFFRTGLGGNAGGAAGDGRSG